MAKSFKETTIRSVVKSVSWRVLATITTIILVYFFTDEISLAFQIGMIEVVLKMIVYFFHERIWDKIKFGREELEVNEAVPEK